MDEKNNKMKSLLYILSIIIFCIGFIPTLEKYKIYIFLTSVILSGYDLIIEGIKNIFHLNFEEDTLMTIAIIAAFILGEYPESVAIILLFKLGEYIEDKAVETANENITNISSIQVKTANLLKENTIEIVEAKSLMRDMKILIKAGEIVPVDCKIVSGTTTLDTSSLTGESTPVEVNKGDEILSGSVNLTGAITCIVIRKYEDSAISKIVDLVYEAVNNKGKKEEYITKFSKIYTPLVIVIAILLAVIPAVLRLDLYTWVNRALVFLVASCPCSIVISIPLAYFSCIGAISKKGMLIKGTKHIESLSKTSIIALDKTGTITTGKSKIKEIKVIKKEITEKEMMQYVCTLEENSNHPISIPIMKYAEENQVNRLMVNNQEEISGLGIKGEIESNQIIVGNTKILEKNNIEYKKQNIPQNAIIIAKNKEIIGYITLEEDIRNEISKTIEELRENKIKRIVMLTGDNEENAKNIVKQCGNIEYRAQLLPENKVEEINKLKKEGKVIFIGDGINDSPVLASSDFGIAMGEGTEIAASSADSILISNNINMIPKAIKLARKTINIVNENIIISLLAKLIVLILGILGIAPVWLAVAADTGITLLTVINSIRIIKN